MPMKLIHATSVHQWDDVRIYHKMARSIANAGYDAHIVALDRKAEAGRVFVSKGVTVHLLPGADIGSRLARSVKGGWRVATAARALRGDLIHLHDPELIPFLFGGLGGNAKLVYDAHEDLVGQIHSKPWVPTPARPLLRTAARMLELAARRADALVAATPHIASKLGSKAVAIQNYPLLEEFAGAAGRGGSAASPTPSAALYAGGITRARGATEMIQALALADQIGTLHLAGSFESGALLAEAQSLPGWARVRYHGHLQRDVLAELMAACDIGLVTFLPHPNHLNAQPNKLFEYLSAGLVVVASDFPAWREMLAPDRLAEFVDPANPTSIADGLRRAAALTPAERQRRRDAGRRMIAQRTNWDMEFRKLLELYRKLLP
jgi:glycosyltransferase involved in cell wall biosynthesis